MDPIAGLLATPFHTNSTNQSKIGPSRNRTEPNSRQRVSLRPPLASLAENSDTAEGSTETQRRAVLTARDRFERQSASAQESGRSSLLSRAGHSNTASSPNGAGVSNTSTQQDDALGDGAQAARSDKQTAAYLQMIRSLSKDDQQAQQVLARLEGAEEVQEQTDPLSTTVEQINEKVTAYYESTFNLNIHIEGRIDAVASSSASNQKSASVTAEGEVNQSDPLVFDLDGDGVELTTARDGSQFDITGDGRKEQTAFATGGDAFLALDKNGNGFIDSGRELFGDQNGAKDGFEELRKYDDNRDNRIDSRDSVYGSLRLFADRNFDGVSQSGELQSLRDAGISSIQLNDVEAHRDINGGTQLSTASFTRNDGSQSTVADVNVNYLA
ncbi:MAG: hypothetical protein P9L94_03710 [Candidatus Hinthialibacter antarcticus]|nr:hypothetical protein [Candidatus Hinthialibacter antarcticus]